MKKLTVKIISLMLISVLCFGGVSSMAVGETKTVFASDNTEFAIKTANVIEKYDSNLSLTQTNSVSEMLRIIGRVSSADFDFSSLGAEICILGADGRFVLQFDGISTLNSALNLLCNDGRVVYAERDRAVYTNSDAADEISYLSWGVEALGIDKYSEHTGGISGETDVTVAIIDSGVEKIDFVKDRLVGGYDFVDNDSDGANDTSADSHGTFLASMIVDSTQGNNVKIMPVRVLSSKTGSMVNAVNGIHYAVDNGADVLNISLGGELKDCSSLDDALNYAEINNVSAVISSGNKKVNTENFCPAHVESAITVSSVDELLVFSSGFSNYGNEVDIVAPGVGITGYSADGTLKTMKGTSMSAAYISAGVALFRLNHPECNASQIQQAVKDSCLDLGEKGFDIYYGHGLPQFDKFISDGKIYVTGIEVSETEAVINIGEEKNIISAVSPANATDKTVIWVSSNPQVASVDGNGKIYAAGTGNCKITALTADGGYAAEINVTVVDPSDVSYPVSARISQLPQKTKYTYKSSEINLDGLMIEVTYSDGTKEIFDGSDAAVSGFETASLGDKTVTVGYLGFEMQFEITVEYAWWQWIIRILLLGFLWY